MILEKVKQLVFPDHGGLRRVRFREGDQSLWALVPEQDRFALLRELILQRVYENGHPIEGGTVVDAGANVGLFSLLASCHAERVIALEAHPITFKVLQMNLETNRIDNVTALHAALWTEDGTVSIGVPDHERERFAVSTGSHVVADIPADTARTVESMSLETVVERYGEIDLLKIDIEGAEEEVIPATKALPHVKRIVGELHLARPGDEKPMLDALRTAGFDARLVSAPDLYNAREARTVLANWRNLDGETVLKLGVLAYLLAPIEKPPGGGNDMPLLVAERR
jgi:FkbM family methyltransferase